MKKLILLALACIFLLSETDAQGKYSKEQILNMSIEELSDLPLEDLMAAVETLGVSSVDELFAMIMNKNVASASKKEENAFTSPLSTTVITRDEMRSWGVSTIEEAFRLIPGVVVQEKTNGVYDVQLRGLNNLPDGQALSYTENQNILLMVDGRDVTNYVQGAVFFETLPISIEDVSRIEVVRGATSALYGQNAVQGVVNIITDKPGSASSLVQGSIQAGSNSTSIGDIAIRSAVNDKFAYGVSFNMQTRQRKTDKISVPHNPQFFMCNPNNAENPYSPLDDDWYSLNDFNNLRYFAAASQSYYSFVPKFYDMSAIFSKPRQSRETYGLNGYLTLTPADEVRFDLTGGYQNSYVLTTNVEDAHWAMAGRTSKTTYANLDANVKGLHAQVSYMQGPQEYSAGVKGYKVKIKNFRAQAEYDFSFGDFSVRPGVAYNSYATENYSLGNGMEIPLTRVETNKGMKVINGMFITNNDGSQSAVAQMLSNDAKFTTVSPSLRFDYKVSDWRFIAAWRMDKTDNPDKANHAFQAAVSKEVGQRNFLRLSYGRSNRSANLMASDAQHVANRRGLSFPELVISIGSDYDLLTTDGFELGWRSRPSDRFLLDAEFFFSKTKNFSVLYANRAYFTLPETTLVSFLNQLSDGVADALLLQDQTKLGEATSSKYIMEDIFSTVAEIKTKNLPLEAKQFGISLNADWILSNKLIAKFNVNFQKTILDNYYAYNQRTALTNMVTKTGLMAGKVMENYINGVMQPAMAQMMSGQPLTRDQIIGYGTDLQQKMNDDEYMLSSYGITKDKVNSYYYFGNSEFVEPERENGVESKSTPNIYGMIGLIYKPVSQLNITAFANFLGKRSYTTMYTTNVTEGVDANGVAKIKYSPDELDPRFTMNLRIGYKTSEACEVFFNAHNLFNTEKQEFVYMDKIGGLYTFGVNFKL
ncbi:MAG: TonB-dependent receptor plug domain-containing protein [Bacteroidales bacterium]|nr:TonB-dependent receptor plug domain-containing protein [Bacteroidales bacterium]